MKSVLLHLLLATVLSLGSFACSTAKKKETVIKPRLSQYIGKKVALVAFEEFRGEATARKISEVALVNQLMERGTFILIPKGEVEQVRTAPDVDPTDWRAIASRAGADIALRVKIKEFKAETSTGYNKVEINDSLLEAERGNGKDTRLVKVEALRAEVAYELEFTFLDDPQAPLEIDTAQTQGEVKADEREGAIHLPPRLRYLEELSNKAFKEFFERNT